MYLYFKSLHIIFVITWFAGLFYVVRLFIYQTEAHARPIETERVLLTQQLRLMARRLWQIIAWPSALLAIIFGLGMLFLQPALFKSTWMQLKLGLVGLLFLYHLYCHVLFVRLQHNTYTLSSYRLRLLNEVPTLLLFPTVFLVVFKQGIGFVSGFLLLASLALLLYMLIRGIRLYQRLKKD